ncbi:F-box/WD repeat-containing protein pof7 [Ceratobasidium sp. AG-Ba]|nr:F-box/WD repeat-containing protein pof7 [Ceratobasidium sp. AG-Ba]QRW02650.1 F-box/WD repeat-containing protein pof7 [Ceratobasidium sp. AG-Ba]
MLPAPPSPPVSPGVRNPSTSTILVPVFSPPTPAPSPRPLSPTPAPQKHPHYPLSFNRDVLPSFVRLSAAQRREFITQLLAACDVDQLVHANALIQPLLKRDFLRELPLEVSLLVLSFVEDAQTLARAAQVSKFWQALLADDAAWKRMCEQSKYGSPKSAKPVAPYRSIDDLKRSMRKLSMTASPALARQSVHQIHFKRRHLTERNWARGGRLLETHTLPDEGVITSVAMDDEWIVVGLANYQIHVFSVQTGRQVRTLLGHTLGVWTLGLVSKGGVMQGPSATGADAQVTPGALRGFEQTDSPRAASSDVCNASAGWGQIGSIVVSGGCDRDVRVWDATTGTCLHTLQGHTSTIRCLKVLDNRPVAVSGSRDTTVRVWDIARGRLINTLQGHTDSVRCLEVSGHLVVSGSYDTTCRLWNVDTGECLKVFRGHHHEVYSVAFDGEKVVTGSLDAQVRIWSASTGECIALHQGHTSLVGQIQLLGNTLVTGGSDGRVILYNTATLDTNHRLSAHDNSVTCLQFDERYVISGGSDGCVKMYDMKTGRFVREMTAPCEAVWRVCFKEDLNVIMCRRAGRTVIEIWTFQPTDEQLGLQGRPSAGRR